MEYLFSIHNGTYYTGNYYFNSENSKIYQVTMNDGTYILEIPLNLVNTARKNMPFYSKKYCNESLSFDNNIVCEKRYIQIRDIENEVFSIVLSKL